MLSMKYVEKMKYSIFETLHMFDQDNITDKQLKREFLKYEIRKFTMQFSKNLIKEKNKYRKFLKTFFNETSFILIVNRHLKQFVAKNK